jgi:DNA-binding transcriptional regulator YiaG
MKPVIKTIATELGVKKATLKKWNQRKMVPHHQRLPLMEKARAMGKRLKPADFDWREAA